MYEFSNVAWKCMNSECSNMVSSKPLKGPMLFIFQYFHTNNFQESKYCDFWCLELYNFVHPLLHIYGSYKNRCFGELYGQPGSTTNQPAALAPQWAGACPPGRRPPHPHPRWKSSSYSPSLLLQLIHRFNLETLLPPLRPHRALHRRLLLMHRHSQQCPRMEMGWTLGSLASSSRSQSRSQCGDRSPSSKATDQQTLAAEEGDKLWRRRKRPAQTQGCDFFQAILFLRFLFAEIE